MHKGTQTWDMIKIQKSAVTCGLDVVAEEYPLTITINGEEFATMVCTPLYLEELVIGFLASEGVIRTVDDIKNLSIDEDRGYAYIETDRKVQSDATSNKRWIASCCGKSRAFYFQNDARTARTVMSELKVEAKQCMKLMEEFQSSAHMFEKTGGVHQAGLATSEKMEISFADIGRHNALDKLYGHMLKHHLKRSNHLIIFSGRISSEVLLKVSKMGIGCLLSKSAPTNLALELANDLNITAVGFVRGERMNVYTHPRRVVELQGEI